MDHYICIHGHFYQPPRENPWLEAIEFQDQAKPYHDWNSRITAECYGPNASSRILDNQGRIVMMVNNYTKMSFNFGPTLLAWMEKNAPKVYESILEADLESQKRFSGHGSSMAQPYNHLILPLAKRRDKKTQMLWGIRDFEYRFGRKPEGMWLPETAVDTETLRIMAELGIRFTILGQHQAKAVRPGKEGPWQNVKGEKVDPTRAYAVRVGSGRSMALFFYDGAISRAVAFERLLNDGESFVQRLLRAYSRERASPQLIHIATDGESYGHHHRFGEMALSYALNAIEARGLARLTNYGEYLTKHPPAWEVKIEESTSWSCAHGVDRWQRHCGCDTGTHPGWNQEWRQYLREALDRLRDAVTPLFEEEGEKLFKDPWEARDDYIHVILDRSSLSREQFLQHHAQDPLSDAEKIDALKLMELQRQAMLMYTSCGWFYDDISGIEAIQVMKHAGRVIHLARDLFGKDLEPDFLSMLSRAKSNVPTEGSGSRIYEKQVKPAWVGLKEIGAHHAMSSLFREERAQPSMYGYRIDEEDYEIRRNGKATFAAGRVMIQSEITTESARYSFGGLHLGDHHLSCGVKDAVDDETYHGMVKEVSSAFTSADFPEAIRILDKHFGESVYSLKSLFSDERSRIVDLILESTVAGADTVYRQLYENHAPLLRFLKDSGGTIPKALSFAAEYVVNADMQKALSREELRREEVQGLLETARMAGVELEVESLEYAFRCALERTAESFSANPADRAALERLDVAVDMAASLPFKTNLWTVQNICYGVLRSTYVEMQARAERGDQRAKEWASQFSALAEKLSLRIP